MILNRNISLHTTKKNITLLVVSVFKVLERFSYFSPSFTFQLNQISGEPDILRWFFSIIIYDDLYCLIYIFGWNF